ncbi:esterase family protein [candidate division KSB1 bacterium]|nr:esterase family protein [candidate division KSB1 bacterium]
MLLHNTFKSNQWICLLKSVIFVLLPALLIAQSGKVYDNLSVKSKILQSERKYAIYLPPDYETSERSYPVLYLLHGSGDDQTGWIQFGEVLRIADKAIFEGTATPMVIVMPDANTVRRGYSNSIQNTWRYEDFFFDELMPHVEKTFRIKGEKRYRAISGLSMGGDGTFTYALHQPDLFSSACPLSAGTGPNSTERIKERIERYGDDADQMPPDSLIEAYLKRQSVVYMMENLDVESIKSVRWYIDCGDDDFLYEGNSLVHIAMRKREIPHEYRVRQGAHNWTYWRDSLPEVLRFVSDAFHQH